MNIGGQQVTGFSAKFWIIIGAVGLLLILAAYLYFTKPPPPDPYVTPAATQSEVSSWSDVSNRGWWKERVNAYGLKSASYSDLTTNYAANLGQPVRFKVFVPSDDVLGERPSLQTNKFGWNFRPGVYIDPTAPQSEDSIADLSDQITEGTPIVLGFPESVNIAAGAPYEVSGLLYWTSNQLNPPSAEEAEQGYTNSPVVLVAEARPLSQSELTAPATQVADIDYVQRWNGLVFTLSRVEWSAGKEVRACISVTNATNQPARDMWAGVDSDATEIELSNGAGFSPGEPATDSALTQPQLSAQSSAVGYLIFNEKAPSADPTGVVTLSFPSLNPEDQSGQGDPERILIHVSPSQFHDVNSDDLDANSSGCASTSSLS